MFRAQDSDPQGFVRHHLRTSSSRTGRCSGRDMVHASAIKLASAASATVQGEVRVPAATSVSSKPTAMHP